MNSSLFFAQKQDAELPASFERFKDMSRLINEAYEGFKRNLPKLKSNLTDQQAAIENLIASGNQLITRMNEISIEQTDMQTVTNYLFRQMTKVSTAGFQRCIEIKAKAKEFENWKRDYPQDKEGIIERAEKLKMMINEEQAKRENFDYTLEGVRACFNLSSAIAVRIGCDKNVLKLLHAGDPFCTIVKHAAGLAGYGTAVAISGPFFPVLAIAGAACTLYDIFCSKDQPNPTAIILESIQGVSKQVDELRKENFLGFQHIDALVREHNAQVHEHLNQLGTVLVDKLDHHHREAIQWLSRISDDNKKLLKKSVVIEEHLNCIEKKIDEGFKYLIVIKDYAKAKKWVLNFHRLNPYPEVEANQVDLNNYWMKMENFALNGSKTSFFAGVSPGIGINIHELRKQLSNNAEPEYSIHLLVDYVRSLGLQQNELFNPIPWADAATTIVECVNVMPEYTMKEAHEESVGQLIKEGIRFEQFILNLKTSVKIFEKVIDEYSSIWLQVVDQLKDIILDSYEEPQYESQEDDSYVPLPRPFLNMLPSKEAVPQRGGRGAVLQGTGRGAVPQRGGRRAVPKGAGRGVVPQGTGRGAVPQRGGRGAVPQGAGRGAVLRRDGSTNMVSLKKALLEAQPLHMKARYKVNKLQRLEKKLQDLVNAKTAGAEMKEIELLCRDLGNLDNILADLGKKHGSHRVNVMIRANPAVTIRNTKDLLQKYKLSDQKAEKLASLNEKVKKMKEKVKNAKIEANKEVISDEDAIMLYIDLLVGDRKGRLNISIQESVDSGILMKLLYELDAHHKVLCALLSLAFRKDNTCDLNFKNQLNKLWKLEDVRSYLQTYVQEEDNQNGKARIFKYSHQIQEVKEFILAKVQQAVQESNGKMLMPGYPLIDHVIGVLEQFKILYFKDAKPLNRPYEATSQLMG